MDHMPLLLSLHLRYWALAGSGDAAIFGAAGAVIAVALDINAAAAGFWELCLHERECRPLLHIGLQHCHFRCCWCETAQVAP